MFITHYNDSTGVSIYNVNTVRQNMVSYRPFTLNKHRHFTNDLLRRERCVEKHILLKAIKQYPYLLNES